MRIVLDRVIVGSASILLGCGCVFDSERRPTIDVKLQGATSYVFRGQTMGNRPVAQVDDVVRLPTRDGGAATFGTFANLDLTDDRGNAWMDSGHGGEFTQIDVWAAWSHDFGAVDLALGARHYAWPNGESFRFAPFPSTSEVFASVGVDVGGLHPMLTLHHDVDEVESLYVRGELAHAVPLSTNMHLELQGWLGWSDADHSRWLYRRAEAGLADLGLAAGLRFDLDAVTSARLTVSGSTIVDSTLRDWFSTQVDADVLWVTAGIGWAF